MKVHGSFINKDNVVRKWIRDKNYSVRLDAARRLIDYFHASLYIKPSDLDKFECFVKWLSENKFYLEDFGQHFVDAWNEKQRSVYGDDFYPRAENVELSCKMYLKQSPPSISVSCCKEEDKMKTQEKHASQTEISPFKSPIVIASIIIALGAIIAVFIIRSRPTPVQHRFQKLNNGEILNVETGEVKTY